MNLNPFSEEIDEIFSDLYVREFLLQLSTSWYSWVDNTEEMYSGDLLSWLIDILDAKLTGEHNSKVRQQRNPKRKPKAGKEISSFARLVMPPRWRGLIQDAEEIRKQKEEREKDQADSFVSTIIENARKTEENS